MLYNFAELHTKKISLKDKKREYMYSAFTGTLLIFIYAFWFIKRMYNSGHLKFGHY